MFTIFRKTVNGRYHDRFFRSWENAKCALIDEVDEFVSRYGWEIIRKIDKMNIEKGFYDFQYDIRKGGMKATLSLLDGYFID